MAIGFGRVEFIKRSEGRNSCQLSAYLSRSRIFFEGNCALEPKLYDFSHRENVSHHEIILPDGADENLKIPEVLWNLAERKEVRKDAQVSMHLVLALPDDKEITLEDRIELTRTFIKKHYHGLVAECVIHPPERKIEFTEENGALGIPKGTIGTVIEEKEGNYIVSLPKEVRANPFVEIGTQYPGMSVQEHNWHAHAQLTTRRLKDNGYELEDKKAIDLMPVIKKGKIVSGPDVGKLWAQHQNEFFLSKGLALRVDENGLVPQEHLGPVRMRGRAFALLEEHEKRLELNEIAASDPQNILNAITKRQSVFTKDDVERFILKHTPADKTPDLIKGFWTQEELVQLRDKQSHEFVSKFTTKAVLNEERQILRLADRISNKTQKQVPESIQMQFTKNLTQEQRRAYKNILSGEGLCCIQGYAGVGKSYLLKALKDAYEERGLNVRSFGPDNATANVLKEKGFSSAENLYRFLYSHKHGLRNLHKGFEVWVLDEAGKVGNKPLLEFLKLAEKKGVKMILAGDSSQLSPVDRGEAFKYFCLRYQTETLQDIQRQKDEFSRSMAKDLALGKTGEALDKLSAKGSIKWSLTKKEAMEDLILKWAEDHRDPGKSGPRNALDSSIIVAHTNPEVRTLNEMVRLVRKQRGEISHREFKCEVISGDQDKATIFISEGDRIEFRKKDIELGVRNRDTGILIRAEKDQFTVALQENGKKTRIVRFDPSQYRGFQLGYASTAHCVQGRTVDRAYILHSPYLNKQMAYVKLTRQVEEVTYFVPKEEAANLSDLKRQALRDGSKSATYDYTDTEEIEKLSSVEKKESEIKALRNSEEFSSRFKGMTIQAWEQVKGKALGFIEKKQDRSQSSEFFSFKGDRIATSRGVVREVTQEELKKLTIVPAEAAEKISPQEVIEKISEQDRAIEINKEMVKMKHKATEIEKDVYEQDANPSNPSKSFKKNSLSWKALPKEERKLLRTYFSLASKAHKLREVVQAECGETLENASRSPHYQEWQKACSQRNASAHQLNALLINEEKRGTLNEKTAYYIKADAQKHNAILQEQKVLQAEKMKDLEGQLGFHVESLLYKLFPDGPSSKTTQSYRFGSKGSLAVSYSGPKAGQFFDFERGEGGGLLKLIARELKLNQTEAKTWAGEFLGIAKDIQLPNHFKRAEPLSKKPFTWISLKPDPDHPAPPLEKLGKLHHYYQEVTRYPYHDLQGNLLFYVLRLENPKGEKITPPLSYGKFNEEDKPSWQLRGYLSETEKRPLYNLHQLKEKPLSRVLVVEGEKAADKGLEKFPDSDFICVSWCGGASSVSKTDWSPLQGREVRIWPDNDQAGFKAAEEICDALKQVGVKKILIPTGGNLFERLPPKWDLADPLPKGVNISSLYSAFPYRNLNHFQESVLREFNRDKNPTLFEKTKALDLLYAYEKTHQKRLKDEFPREISLNERGTISYKQQYEGLQFIRKEEDIFRKVTEDPAINASGKLAERLTHQIHLYEAKHSNPPTLQETLKMQKTIEGFSQEILNLKGPEEIKEAAIYRALSYASEKAIRGEEMTITTFEKTLYLETKELSLQKELAKSHEQALQKEQTLQQEKELSRGSSLSL